MKLNMNKCDCLVGNYYSRIVIEYKNTTKIIDETLVYVNNLS